MSRMIYVYDDMAGGMVPKAERDARRFANQPTMRNPDLASPAVISDTMESVQSMLDGRRYDSKSRLRRTYKEGGVIEVGNDPSIMDPKPFRPPRPDPEAIRASVARGISLANLTTSTPGDDVRIKDWTPTREQFINATPTKSAK